MRTKTYQRTYGEIIVEEMGRREFAQMAAIVIEDIFDCKDDDTTVYVRYKDGSEYTCSLGCGSEGRFTKLNIDFGCISNPATYQVTGKYAIDRNGICYAA